MKAKEILFIVISSFILVLAWVIFNVYHSSVSSTIPENINIQILPIDPNFNTQVIDGLKTRKKVSPLYETVVSVTPTQAAASSSSSLSPTPVISSSPTATGGGTL